MDIEAGVWPGENALGPLEGPARAVAAGVGKAADIKPLLAKFGTWEEKKITDPDFKCVMPSRISDCRWKVKADLGMRHGASWRLYKSMRLTRER